MSVLYLDHFSLAADPFRITPDTEFFFTGGQRGDILEGLIVAAMHDEGIVSVVGEIGMGKTMLSRMLLERLRPLPSDTVYLANPVFDRDEILGAIAHDLMPVPPQGNRAHMLAALEAVLIERYSQGRRVVVVIDEAHSMPATTLEEIRLLSNLETTQHKLLKIVLFGQPELDELLDAPQLRQVKDRISHRFELQPLNADEASAYLRFRLHKAGWTGGELFDAEALKLLVQASGGRTRRLNMLADKSLLAAYAEGVSQVGAGQVARAAGDSLPHARRKALGETFGALRGAGRWPRLLPAGLGALAILALGYGLGYGLGQRNEAQPLAAGPQQRSAALVEVQAASAAPVPPAPPAPAPVAVAVTSPTAQTTGTPGLAPVLPKAATDEADSPLRSDSLATRMQATHQFIANPATTGFTVQVLSQKAPRQAEVMLMAQEIQQALDQGAEKSNQAPSTLPVLIHDRLYHGQVFHAMYVGHFESRLAAMKFVESSPPAVKRYKPVIRSLDAIRKEPAP
ncbi:ExeA family protein [Polaromonas sp.]|uniref:ExeA family protein n=1 Tax=Polaromonas sp. TaxID=1869339 RepID=UPI003569CB93